MPWLLCLNFLAEEWNKTKHCKEAKNFTRHRYVTGEASISDEKAQDKSGVSLGNQGIAMRAEQEKETKKVTIVIREQACNIHTSSVLVDMDLKSIDGSYCSCQNEMPTSSPTTHDSVGQNPKYLKVPNHLRLYLLRFLSSWIR